MRRTLWASLTDGLLGLLGRKRRAASREAVSGYLETLGYPVVGDDGEVLGADSRSAPTDESGG